jgi:hypothetical protein
LGLFYLTGPSEFDGAVVTILIGILIALLNPVNGIMLIGLSVPFFLEAGSRPYFFVLEGFIFATLISSLIHYKKRIDTPFPFAYLFIAPLLATMAALPLDLLAIPQEFWARSFYEIIHIFFTSHQGSTVYYFREISNVATAVGLGYATWAFWPRSGDLALRWIETFIVLTVIVGVIGLGLYFNVLPQGNPYLFLSLVGFQEKGVTAFAFNMAFFVQSSSLGAMAAALLTLFGNRSAIIRIGYGIATLFLFALMTPSMLRIVPVIGVFTLLTLVIVAFYLNRKMLAATLLISGGSIAGAVGAFLYYDWCLFHKGGGGATFVQMWSRLGIANHRIHLWDRALAMFSEFPMLGVGTGRYLVFFDTFADPADPHALTLPKIPPHSLFFELAAEQGLVGLMAIGTVLMFVFLTIIAALYGLKSTGASASIAPIVVVALLALILTHATFNQTFHVRSIQCLFWILLGTSIFLVPQFRLSTILMKRGFLFFLTFILIALPGRAIAINEMANRDTPPLSIGFHNRERLPGGGWGVWTRLRAVSRIAVDHNGACLAVSAPLPGIDRKPQESVLTLGNETQQVTLNNGEWHYIHFAAKGIDPGFAPIRIENQWTFKPKEAGVSSDARDLGLYVRFLTPEACLVTFVP